MTDCVVITGLSGAGRTTAADVLEDRGWFVIDNLPVALMPRIVELDVEPASRLGRVAFVMGAVAANDELIGMIDHLRDIGWRVRVLFLDARSDVLIRRYEATRRRHPSGADELLGAAIEAERARFDGLRAIADAVIDTSDLNIHQLRERIGALVPDADGDADMAITVLSFGFKHGLPSDVDMVFDCRFLPNPHWDEKLRPMSGRDEPVRDHVLESELAGPFVEEIERLLGVVVPAFEDEGKPYLTLAFGCTGGRHRSVAIAEEIARRLAEDGRNPRVDHRDLDKHA